MDLKKDSLLLSHWESAMIFGPCLNWQVKSVKQEEQEEFASKAKDYKNLWHPEHRLFMPKDEEGEWIDINPKSDGGPGYRNYYDENNGWTYAWDVQHDIEGLAELLGGTEAAEKRLDQLFREPLGMRKREFYVHGANSTGMVGQFSMGNEPSFHIPYLYNYFGAPWKTQKKTRFLLDVWFKDNIFGIPGDEDGGGMTCVCSVFFHGDLSGDSWFAGIHYHQSGI